MKWIAAECPHQILTYLLTTKLVSGHGTIDHKTSLCFFLPENFRSCIRTGYIDKKTGYWVGPCSTRTLRLSNIWLMELYIAHLWSLWWGEVISELWFRPVFRPTTREFSILILDLFVTFPVAREKVELGVELLPSLLWWDVLYNTGRKGKRMRDML